MDSASAFWERFDKLIMQKHLGFHQGIPAGIGRFDITTRDDFLQDILNNIGVNSSDYDQEEIPSVIDEDGDTWHYLHSFVTSRQWRGHFWMVQIFRSDKTGKVRMVRSRISSPMNRLEMFMKTTAIRQNSALVRAEEKAKCRLFEELNDYQKEHYILSDIVMERGRSGVAYIIRKNRPTIAFREGDGVDRPLCALCLHPWAYYTGSWAGAMPPSDEMLAHLLYIRSDEHLFWRRANQISIENDRSGI